MFYIKKIFKFFLFLFLYVVVLHSITFYFCYNELPEDALVFHAKIQKIRETLKKEELPNYLKILQSFEKYKNVKVENLDETLKRDPEISQNISDLEDEFWKNKEQKVHISKTAEIRLMDYFFNFRSSKLLQKHFVRKSLSLFQKNEDDLQAVKYLVSSYRLGQYLENLHQIKYSFVSVPEMTMSINIKTKTIKDLNKQLSKNILSNKSKKLITKFFSPLFNDDYKVDYFKKIVTNEIQTLQSLNLISSLEKNINLTDKRSKIEIILMNKVYKHLVTFNKGIIEALDKVDVDSNYTFNYTKQKLRDHNPLSMISVTKFFASSIIYPPSLVDNMAEMIANTLIQIGTPMSSIIYMNQTKLSDAKKEFFLLI